MLSWGVRGRRFKSSRADQIIILDVSDTFRNPTETRILSEIAGFLLSVAIGTDLLQPDVLVSNVSDGLSANLIRFNDKRSNKDGITLPVAQAYCRDILDRGKAPYTSVDKHVARDSATSSLSQATINLIQPTTT